MELKRIKELVFSIREDWPYEGQVKGFLLKLLEDCEGSDWLKTACCLKLLIESGIQMLYLRRFKPEERERVLRRRARRAASFNMSMLERSGLPGPYKAKVLRAYLAIAAYVHPSPEALEQSLRPRDVEKAVEAIELLFSALAK